MTKNQFKILLDDKLIGTTLLEKADVPMGVVFGQIKLENIDNAYTFFKSYCLQNQIGFFVNTLPIRVDVLGNFSYKEFLANERLAILKSFDYQYFPFELLVQELQPKRDMS